jgi:hypothetical protein
MAGAAFSFSQNTLMPSGVDLSASPGFTWVAWIKLQGSGFGYYPLLEWGTINQTFFTFSISGPSQDGIPIRCLYVQFSQSQARGYYTRANTVPLDQWQRVSFTWNTNRSFSAYITGGGGIGGATGFAPDMSGQMRIGGRPNASLFFYGLMDEIRLFDRALTGEELQALPLEPPQPSVALRPIDKTRTLLAWPAAYSDFHLESAPAVVGPWLPIQTAPTLDGPELTLEQPIDGLTRLFRLRYP